MSTLDKIKKTGQRVAKHERQLALRKIKERKAQTRHKIQLGGLVVKAHLSQYPKDIILGALIDVQERLAKEPGIEMYYQSKGQAAFMEYIN